MPVCGISGDRAPRVQETETVHSSSSASMDSSIGNRYAREINARMTLQVHLVDALRRNSILYFDRILILRVSFENPEDILHPELFL